MTLYTDDKAAVRTAVQRGSRKLAALDLATKKPAAKPTAWKRIQRYLAKRRLAVLSRTRAAWHAPANPAPHIPTERQASNGYGR